MIISQTPVRISFAGGGTDLPAFYQREGGAVVSAAIDRYAYAALSVRSDARLRITSEDLLVDETYGNLDELPESLELIRAVLRRQKLRGGFHLHLESEIPVGSGLGLSSAVCVNLVNLLFHHRGESISKGDLAWLASEIEMRDLGRPIGRQDHYAAAFGGLNLIEFTREGVGVKPLRLSEETLRTLESRLLLFFTGRTRDSASILRGQEERVRKGQRQVLAALRRLKQLAYEMVAALEAGQLNDFGDLLHESWVTKQRLSDRIGNPQIAAWYELARELGARGGKISGAGGGGFLLLYAEEERHALIREVLTTLGLQELPFRFDRNGSRIIHREGAGMTPRGYLVGLNSIVRGLSEQDIERVIGVLEEAYRRGRQVFVMGNGGSAATASHFSCDLAKTVQVNGKPGFRVISLTDNVALMTALGNDVGYEDVFRGQLANLLRPDDVVVGISGGGRSPSVLKAIRFAREKGATTVAFTGMVDGGGPLAELVDHAIVVPSSNYQYIEDVHMMLVHLMTTILRQRLFEAPSAAKMAGEGRKETVQENPGGDTTHAYSRRYDSAPSTV